MFWYPCKLHPIRTETSCFLQSGWITVFSDDHHLWILVWMNLRVVVVVVCLQNVRKLWKMSVSVFPQHKLTSWNASFVHNKEDIQFTVTEEKKPKWPLTTSRSVVAALFNVASLNFFVVALITTLLKTSVCYFWTINPSVCSCREPVCDHFIWYVCHRDERGRRWFTFVWYGECLAVIFPLSLFVLVPVWSQTMISMPVKCFFARCRFKSNLWVCTHTNWNMLAWLEAVTAPAVGPVFTDGAGPC